MNKLSLSAPERQAKMRQVIIQRESPAEVNSQNHPKELDDEEVQLLDYRTEIDKTSLLKWRSLIDYPIVLEWTFTPVEIRHLMDSMQVSLISKRLSSLHREELDEIIQRLDRELSQISSPHGWFCRFARCSPKDGCRAWPLLSSKQVVEQVVTSVRAQQALQHGGTTLYLCRYLPNWDPHREVRVFVYRGRVTAISQYTARSHYFERLTDEQLERVAHRILQELTELMGRLIEAFSTSNFTCDMYIEEDRVRIVEFNSFGYWLAAGSGHFHWLTDRALLYGTNEELYFRIGELSGSQIRI